MEQLTLIFSSTLFLCTTLVFVIYFYLRYIVFNVWNRKKVPHAKPLIPLGNVPVSYLQGKIPFGKLIKDSYDEFRKHRYYGMYILWEPVLVINDPELIQLVLVKNFTNFYNRGVLSSQHKDPLSLGLVRLYDEKWKRLRGKLTPTFTSGKLKQMYVLLDEICHELVDVYADSLKGSDVINIKDLTTRFTVDCISSIAFGFNCNSLRTPETDFLKYGKLSNNLGRLFILLSFFIPGAVNYYPVPKNRQSVKGFFIDLFEKMVSYRKKEKIVRNDFLNMLMQLMDHGQLQENEEASSEPQTTIKVKDSDKLTKEEAMSQAFLFFSAGQETTASVVTCCLYELSFNHEIQERLYQEIYEVNNTPGELSYEKLFKMEYLDMVFQETLRKHPGQATLNRICTEEFMLPNSNLKIEKGTRLVIPILGIHRDPDIYPEPRKFDPERFTPENKAKRHSSTYVPFGEGPRQCIGKRLGLLQPKIALFYLILNYKFSTCDKTAVPIEYAIDYFVLSPENVYLKVEKRNKRI